MVQTLKSNGSSDLAPLQRTNQLPQIVPLAEAVVPLSSMSISTEVLENFPLQHRAESGTAVVFALEVAHFDIAPVNFKVPRSAISLLA